MVPVRGIMDFINMIIAVEDILKELALLAHPEVIPNDHAESPNGSPMPNGHDENHHEHSVKELTTRLQLKHEVLAERIAQLHSVSLHLSYKIFF